MDKPPRWPTCPNCKRPLSLSPAQGSKKAFECSFCENSRTEFETLGRPSNAEALRMLLAFCSIMEPGRRSELMERAERYAAQSEVVAGVTHFSLLSKDTLPEA